MGYIGIGLGMAMAHMLAKRYLQADDIMGRLLVFIEQTSLDAGKMDIAWLMTLLPVPVWKRFPPAPRGGKGKDGKGSGNTETKFATLADPTWTTVALQYLGDLAALHLRLPIAVLMEARKKLRSSAVDGEDL